MMDNTRQELLSDTIRFLKENHEMKKNFIVKPELISSIKAEKKKQEPLPQPSQISFPVRKPPSLQRKAPPPPLKKEKIEPSPIKPKRKEPTLSYPELSKKLKQSFPNFPLVETPLKDESRFIKALKAEIVIFSFSEGKKPEAFLKNLNKAITAHHAEATICDPTQWKTQEECSLFLKRTKAKLFIASFSVLESMLFLPFLKELPASSKRFLEERPLIVLEPFTTYFEDPKSKQSLWNTLCSTLASS